MLPVVRSFHDPATSTFTYLVYDRIGGHAAVIDPVLDYDPASDCTSTASADKVLAVVEENRLAVDWILETHAHADHLTAAAYLKARTGAKVAIGRGITRVQERVRSLFDLEPEFRADGSQFDRLLDDGDTFRVGRLEVRAVATPGHTEDSLAYVVGDAAFVGDTVFAPETGTARADFPGGDARKLYRSIRRLLDLPPTTRLFLCHDYPTGGREPRAQTSVEAQRLYNVHVGGHMDEDTFVAVRSRRDATLAPPRLIVPSLQANIRAGQWPPADANGAPRVHPPRDHAGDVA